MSLITCQARPNFWADWCAQPGVGPFGRPWSSWERGPACKCTPGKCDKGREWAQAAPAPAIAKPQMELEL